MPQPLSSLDNILRQEQARIDLFATEARRSFERISDDLRLEFRTNLNQILQTEVHGFVREVRAALSELGGGTASQGGDALGAALENITGDLLGNVLGDVLSGRRVNTRRAANDAARIVLGELFPKTGRSGRVTSGHASDGQLAAELWRVLGQGKRFL